MHFGGRSTLLAFFSAARRRPVVVVVRWSRWQRTVQFPLATIQFFFGHDSPESIQQVHLFSHHQETLQTIVATGVGGRCCSRRQQTGTGGTTSTVVVVVVVVFPRKTLLCDRKPLRWQAKRQPLHWQATRQQGLFPQRFDVQVVDSAVVARWELELQKEKRSGPESRLCHCGSRGEASRWLDCANTPTVEEERVIPAALPLVASDRSRSVSSVSRRQQQFRKNGIESKYIWRMYHEGDEPGDKRRNEKRMREKHV